MTRTSRDHSSLLAKWLLTPDLVHVDSRPPQFPKPLCPTFWGQVIGT